MRIKGKSFYGSSFILSGFIIAGFACCAYWNGFSGPFVFDDVRSIPENATLRSLRPLSGPLSPYFQDGRTVDGRPILNLSFAISYAFGGMQVWAYHASNLLIHILAGWTLFGILRRTFLRPALQRTIGDAALPLAAVTAALWVVHPLQTESVTYIVQRAESLSGLFYLLTLYWFIRGAESAKPHIWYGLSVAACLLGMGTKESMVTAPIMVLLYDRTFIAGTFREAFGRRWQMHAALMATWFFLAWLMIQGGSRGGTAGFHTPVSPWFYFLTQCRAILHYLQLAVWPDPLVFDYGYDLIRDPLTVAPHILILAALAIGTLIALWRRPVLGFALCWIFVILAPTSSFVPSALQVVAERRMYLPLAGVLALIVIGIYRLAGRRSIYIFAVWAIALAALTILRNHDYRSEESIWRDTVNKCPGNARAQNTLALLMLDKGEMKEANERFMTAVRLDPGNSIYHVNLGNMFAHIGEPTRAIEEFQAALRLTPGNASAHGNLANVFMMTGERDQAMKQFQEALRLDPKNARTHSNLGILLMSRGEGDEALHHFEAAVKLEPGYAEGHNNLGFTLIKMGRREEAMEQFREALRLDPSYEQAKINLKRFEPPAGAAK
ncbi:MAG: tetratricopeptide repeat protein [Chthoniobacterales bacterium]